MDLKKPNKLQMIIFYVCMANKKHCYDFIKNLLGHLEQDEIDSVKKMLEKFASFLEDSGTKDMFKSEYDLTNSKILDKIDKIKSDIKGDNNIIMHKDMPSTSFQEMEKAINETPVEIENRDMMSFEDIEKTTNELNTAIESIDKDSNVITENKKSLDGFKKTKQALDDYILCMYGE